MKKYGTFLLMHNQQDNKYSQKELNHLNGLPMDPDLLEELRRAKPAHERMLGQKLTLLEVYRITTDVDPDQV